MAAGIAFICQTCGAQHAPSAEPPARCAICEDERQYVGAEGQRWITLPELRASHRAVLREEGPGLLGIGIEPSVAIGQRALLVQTDAGNVLWDCIPLLDDAVIDAVRARGGLSAIAISHPHFYTGMVEWARAFDCPVHLHRADAEWVMRPDPAIAFWEGESFDLLPGVTLVRLGGHFPGGTVLHWSAGDGGRGALLTGDILQVVADTRWVSFMRSYPNLIPLPGFVVERMAARVASLEFGRLYGGWFGRVVQDGPGAVARSARRYVRALAADPDAAG